MHKKLLAVLSLASFVFAASACATYYLQTPEDQRRFDSIDTITDQSVLTDMALHDRAQGVREKATTRLTDQTLLDTMARKDPNARVRYLAVLTLTDQPKLADFALHAPDWIVRSAAIENLQDENLLARIAREDERPWVRRQAASRVRDEKLLAALIAENRNELFSFLKAGTSVVGMSVNGLPYKEDTGIPPGKHTVQAALRREEPAAEKGYKWIYSGPAKTAELTAALGLDFLVSGEIIDVVNEGQYDRKYNWKISVVEQPFRVESYATSQWELSTIDARKLLKKTPPPDK